MRLAKRITSSARQKANITQQAKLSLLYCRHNRPIINEKRTNKNKTETTKVLSNRSSWVSLCYYFIRTSQTVLLKIITGYSPNYQKNQQVACLCEGCLNQAIIFSFSKIWTCIIEAHLMLSYVPVRRKYQALLKEFPVPLWVSPIPNGTEHAFDCLPGSHHL